MNKSRTKLSRKVLSGKSISRKVISRKSISRKGKSVKVIAVNQVIINVLETVKKYYLEKKDIIHVNSYERAIYQLKKYPEIIKSGKQVSHLEGIGKGMIQKIDTILQTGTLPIITEQKLLLSRDINIPDNYKLTNILGIGENEAKKITAKYGIKTIPELQELLKKDDKILNRTQLIGLKYYNDLKQLIPRNEITEIGNIIEKCISNNIENVLTYLAGSYPSGLKTHSKDIDILLVDYNINDDDKLIKNGMLQNIVNILDKCIDLHVISQGDTKFLGIVKIKEAGEHIWRHLDMRIVRPIEFPYAYLYYSSGKIFNKFIREKIKKINKIRKITKNNRTSRNQNHSRDIEISSNEQLKLNEWGLYKNSRKIKLPGELDNLELVKKIKECENNVSRESSKKYLLKYSENIEKEIFKIARLKYQTINERY